MSVLELNDIDRHFGRTKVLDQVALEIQTGEKVALLGRNGSGKTTLLRIAAGTLRPTAGHLKVGRTAYVPQDAPIYPELSCQEHLELICGLHSTRPDVKVLGALAPMAARSLSRGQRQRLHLTMALQSGAPLLLLDEPFTGLDAGAIRWLEDALVAHEGAILMSLHDADRAARLCDRSIHLEGP